MNRFTVRVQLNRLGPIDQRASRDVYARLAENLAVWGIADTIRSDSGVLYRMFDGDYNYEGPDGIDAVRANATIAASAVAPDISVFVTEAQNRVWQGLEVVREPKARGIGLMPNALATSIGFFPGLELLDKPKARGIGLMSSALAMTPANFLRSLPPAKR